LLALGGAGWQSLHRWLTSPVPNVIIMNLPTLFLFVWYRWTSTLAEFPR
jgi:hypothetical protein